MRISDWSSDVCSSDLLRERGGIAEAEVEPLPRDRMDAVRRITDQRQPFGGDRRGVVEAERIARSRLEGRQRAEETAHALCGLEKESAIGELENPGTGLRRHAPPQARARAGPRAG